MKVRYAWILGQKEKIFTNTNKGTKKFKVYPIPTGATGFFQPLDVYGFKPEKLFRTFEKLFKKKNFLRHFSDLVILHNYAY